MNGQINVTYGLDPADWSALVLKLNELAGNKTRTYIARALNKTATTARKKLAQKAQETHTVKKGGFNKDMRIDRANAGNLVATIKSNGETLNIHYFKWSPNGSHKGGETVKFDAVKSGLKERGLNGNKAFVMRVGRTKYNKKTKEREKVMRKDWRTGEMKQVMANLVFARTGKSRLPIWILKGPSAPGMLASDRVYGAMKPEIQSDLNKYINQQIKMLLG